ncbi:GNAT family N-acetyltransferase [Carboxylicivirga marina]|uniref:GNAT family N-acetyltransferase n=1 Tax=Carboxylicivirga marina TaxID=2800988 RepID=A0ABS1HG72_9BACT|nr:GNAT family N-acetyltransferase [Carboxylicivirga marina]MBK3516577.1 GNAT family N-acetyltransferase [Carboxylicivirga marina]
MHIHSLKDSSFEQIHDAFSTAFADYEIQLNKQELKNMLQRRGFVPELSFAAMEGEAIVSFTLNGIGDFNGRKTAYDTGTGTIPDFRGQGLATKIFEYSIPYLKEAGVQQYLLEVLQHNTKAVNIYRNIGFEVSREFNYFVRDAKELSIPQGNKNASVSIQEIGIEACMSLQNHMDFHPSWQNSFAAIQRQKDKFIVFGAFYQGNLVAYCILESCSGDITQLLVKRECRRQGVGTTLLKAAIERNEFSSVKVINTDVHCQSITAFLNSFNIPVSGKQFEMIKTL